MNIPSNHKQVRFLNYAISKSELYEQTKITIDHSFYSQIKLNEDEAIYIAKALNNKGLIEFTEYKSPYYQFVLTDKAFSYLPELKDYLFRFWLPLLISSCFSVAALVISILTLILKQ